jgi:hypothetical protein
MRPAAESGQERARRPHGAKVVDQRDTLDSLRLTAEEARARTDARVADEQIDARVPREDARRDRLDRRAVGDVALLVLVCVRWGAREANDQRAARPQLADELFADPRRGSGDDRYLQTRTARPAAASRPPASITLATRACLPFASFAVFHGRE